MRDWGLFVGTKLPWVLAGDVAGVIESIGPETSTSFEIDDQVMGLCNPTMDVPDSAGAQEYCILTVDSMAKIPDSVKKEDAVTVPLNLATTFIALFSDTYGLNWPAPWETQTSDFDPSAQTLILLGAGSNCAKFALPLAKMRGINRIIAIAGPSNEDELKELGATHFIDRHASDEDIKAQVHEIVPQDEVVYVYDCYNWTYELASSLLSTTKSGRLAVLHSVDPEGVLKRNPLVRAMTVRCSNENLGRYRGEFWRRLPGWLEKGEVLPAKWKIVGDLDAVEEVNGVLDGYAGGKGGAQGVIVP